MLKAGTAHRVINNEIGTSIQAAGHDRKVAYVRDDLEANVLWLEGPEKGLLFVSCDLIGLEIDYVKELLPRVGETCGIPWEDILLGCTHTHSGPSLVGPSHPDKKIDAEYQAKLEAWICDAAKEAMENSEPVSVAWGLGHAGIGFNRRVCYADGSHQMHGDPTRPDFTGMEGPVDHSQAVLFVKDMNGKLKGILHNNAAHPVTFYGADFLSADYPGMSRASLRDVYGDIAVLFFNGAIGDISHVSEEHKACNPQTREEKMARAAHLLAGETMSLLQVADFRDEVELDHVISCYDVGLRKMSPERIEWAGEVMEKYRQDGDLHGLDAPTAYMTLLYDERYGNMETETIHLHAGYVGGMAFVSVPCEIFTHFALHVKRRSPFDITAFFGVTCGEMGYCPTVEGVLGGSWEGTVSLSSRWEIEAGYRIVDELCRMLYELKRKVAGIA